ncbi:hypothetical protein PG993_007212 [Apiospora rasikravindrae]|uniref:Uncharacterized protein n=1 Tax=Apiospora rasikravindrae TaxID=990691 RepID=A0ABR1SWV2_9PEZI
MPIRDGSPPAPARSRDDSEDEDDDEDHAHKTTAHANGKRNAASNSGSSSSSEPNTSSSHTAIPQMTCWAPAMFVPAKFDYTQPQEQEKELPPHQRLNNLLADLDAHAAAVRSNHAWMVGREARRIQQETAQDEARMLASGQPLPRSKRLAPSAGDEAALLRNMAAVPPDLQHLRRHSNPNNIPTFRRSSHERSSNDNNSSINNNNTANAAAAADPAAAASRFEVPKNFSYREVSALPVDQRDTPREAAVTSILNVARNAMHTADWYSSGYQQRRNDKITGWVSEKANSFAQQQDAGSGKEGVSKPASSAAAAPASAGTSGGPTRRVSFGGLDGADDPVDDDGDVPMDLD